MNLPNGLDDFEGQWVLTRTIRDARAGQVMQAEGQARFHRDAQGLIYDEEVALHLPNQPPIRGTRRYLWRTSADGIAVHFDDGRYFHHLDLGRTAPTDHHDCAPDSYDAAYDFGAWPRWKVCWIVSGPRKSYEMNTEYAKR